MDYIDKRTMEIIKFTLSKSIDQFAVNAHDCTFVGEVKRKFVLKIQV